MTDAQLINLHITSRRMNVGSSDTTRRRLDPDRMSNVVETYRTALRRLVGKRSYANFELLLLRSVSDAVVSLRRHGIGNEDSFVALAACHVLDSIERRGDAMNWRSVQADEGDAIDALLRLHDRQLSSERLTPLLMAQAIVGVGERDHRRNGRRRAVAIGRRHVNDKKDAYA